MTRARAVVRSSALGWLRANPEVRAAAAKQLDAYGKALPDAVLEDPARLLPVVKAAIVEAVQHDAPAGVVEELLQVQRVLAIRLRWLADNPGTARELASLQGLRDHHEIAPALREALGRATDDATRAGLTRLAAAADRAVFLGPDGLESSVVPTGPGPTGPTRPGPTDPGTTVTTTDPGTTRPTTNPGTDPGTRGTNGRTTDPGTNNPGTTDPGTVRPGSDPNQALADAGAQLGAGVGTELGVPGGAETGAAYGAQYAVELAPAFGSGGPVGGVGEGSPGGTFSSHFWGAVGGVVGGLLLGPPGAAAGYAFGTGFGGTPTGIAGAQLLGTALAGITEATGIDATTIVACVLCGPACVVCVLASDMGAP
jgi:hypothetical protein